MERQLGNFAVTDVLISVIVVSFTLYTYVKSSVAHLKYIQYLTAHSACMKLRDSS